MKGSSLPFEAKEISQSHAASWNALQLYEKDTLLDANTYCYYCENQSRLRFTFDHRDRYDGNVIEFFTGEGSYDYCGYDGPFSNRA